jgi:putative N-acetylmannosamine-6-phosphate epimerase
MSSDFAPLLEFLERRFGGIEEQLAGLKQGFDTLQTTVDGYAKRADAYFQEMVVLTHQVERHERWLHQIADKLGVKLEY